MTEKAPLAIFVKFDEILLPLAILEFGPNERRGLPKAEKSIIRHAQHGFFSGLKATTT